MRERVIPAIRKASDNGRLTVVCDASSCTEGFRHMIETDPELSVEVMDGVAFVARHVLPVRGEYRKLDSLTVHPTCSSTQMGLNPDLMTVAKAVAVCPTAGDRLKGRTAETRTSANALAPINENASTTATFATGTKRS